MTADNQQKRSRLSHRKFLSAVVYTVFFLSLYLLGLYWIPAPEEVFLGTQHWLVARKLLGWVFSYQIQVNFIIFTFSTFFTAASTLLLGKQELDGKRNLEGFRSALSKFIKPNLLALVGIFQYWELVRGSRSLLLLTYLSLFVSNSIFELLIQGLDEHGVCRGFDLIFFVSKFPLRITLFLFLSLLRTVSFMGDQSDLERSFTLLFILLVISFFIFIANRKWEVPINTNRIDFTGSGIDYLPTFTLRTSFSLFPLTFIPTLLKLCGVLLAFATRLLKKGFAVSPAGGIFSLWEEFGNGRLDSASFGEVFFAINNAANPFSAFSTGKKNIVFIPALVC